MASLIDAQIERSGSKYQMSYNLTLQNKIATEYEFSNVAVPPLISSSKQIRIYIELLRTGAQIKSKIGGKLSITAIQTSTWLYE